MNCPNCQAEANRVTDKRAWEGNGLSGTKRRRVCSGCGDRWTTLEVVVTFGPGRVLILPGMNGNGAGTTTHGPQAKPVPKPKPQKALTVKEKELKKRLAMALHRARCRAVVIEDEEWEE